MPGLSSSTGPREAHACEPVTLRGTPPLARTRSAGRISEFGFEGGPGAGEFGASAADGFNGAGGGSGPALLFQRIRDFDQGLRAEVAGAALQGVRRAPEGFLIRARGGVFHGVQV